MSKSLDEAKRELRARYLGKHGIHAVGIRTSENAICVYVDPSGRIHAAEVLDNIRSDAAPFKLIVIEEEPPAVL